MTTQQSDISDPTARTGKEGVAGDNLHSVETTKPMGDLKPKTEKKRVLE
jgi:hypothetical protein